MPKSWRDYQEELNTDRAAALTGLKWLALAVIVIGGAVVWALVLR